MARRREPDPFRRPPGGFDTGRLEDSVCRTALRYARVSPGVLLRAAGEPADARVTFELLHHYAEFPSSPAVSDVTPEAVMAVVADVRRSKLFSAWLALDEPRHMVFRAAGWGLCVMRVAGKNHQPTNSHVYLATPDGHAFAVEPFLSWLRATGWDGGGLGPGPGAPDDDSGWDDAGP